MEQENGTRIRDKKWIMKNGTRNGKRRGARDGTQNGARR